MIRVKVSGVIDARVGKRQLTEATKAGLLAAVERWHEQYMPGHFTVAGGRKYGYRPRRGDDEPPRLPTVRADGTRSSRLNAAYSWRKRREKRHNRPLVWSGQSEQMARQQVRLSAAKRGAGLVAGTAAMTLPRYFYQYLKPGTYRWKGLFGSGTFTTSGSPDKADELTRTTPDEVAALGQAVQAAVVRRLEQALTTPSRG